MGRIKHTEVAVNDIVGNIVSEEWYNMMDAIEDAKEETRVMAYEAVAAYLEDHDIDVDDWEAVLGEDLNEYIDELIYAEWEV